MTRADRRPGELLWTPSRQRTTDSAMCRFLEQVCAEEGLPASYEDLWQWSVEHPDRFWPRLATFFGVRATGAWTPLRDREDLSGAGWFPALRLNWLGHLERHAQVYAHLRDLLSGWGRRLIWWRGVQPRRHVLGVVNMDAEDPIERVIARGDALPRCRGQLRHGLRRAPSSGPRFEAAGCEPFVYRRDAVAGQAVSMSYFSAPHEAMESPPLMQPWARLALAAALRARAAKPLASRPVSKARPRKGAASKAPAKL